MREHAADRFQRLDVIRHDESLQWAQLESAEASACWPVPVVDAARPADDVAAELTAWLIRERAIRDAGG
jgi:hypothetical protein